MLVMAQMTGRLWENNSTTFLTSLLVGKKTGWKLKGVNSGGLRGPKEVMDLQDGYLRSPQKTGLDLWGGSDLENARAISKDHEHLFLYVLYIGMHEFHEVHGLLPKLFFH
jgi:hypothetical protein